MKKALSLVLSVAMLMTVAFSMFVMPASAEEVPNTYNLLDEAYIAEGADYITINDDGTWTITGPIALSPYITYDYTVHYNVIQQFTSTAGVSITFLDRDPNGVYADNWINLYGNWSGPDFFPAGDINQVNSIKGVYDWNIKYGWGNTDNIANIRAIYITPAEGGTVTMTTLALNNGIYDYDLGAQEYTYDTTYDLAVKDADAWTGIPTSGSNVNVTVDGDKLIMGNTNAAWPSAFIDFDEPIVIDEQAMVYADFSIEKGAKTTIYLFFGQATCNEFDNGAYGVVHKALGDEIAAGNYKGYVSVEDFLPTDEAARAACYNEDGELVVTGIKIFATSEGEAAMDPAITINALDLLYTAPEVDPDVLVGDIDNDGVLGIMDVMGLYGVIAGEATLEDQTIGDVDANGSFDIMDVMALYNIVAGV